MNFDKINFSNKIVIIRVDYNVPFDGDIIQDDSRIKKSIYAINKCRVWNINCEKNSTYLRNICTRWASSSRRYDIKILIECTTKRGRCTYYGI